MEAVAAAAVVLIGVAGATPLVLGAERVQGREQRRASMALEVESLRSRLLALPWRHEAEVGGPTHYPIASDCALCTVFPHADPSRSLAEARYLASGPAAPCFERVLTTSWGVIRIRAWFVAAERPWSAPVVPPAGWSSERAQIAPASAVRVRLVAMDDELFVERSCVLSAMGSPNAIRDD
jgi:hypothetical protein